MILIVSKWYCSTPGTVYNRRYMLYCTIDCTSHIGPGHWQDGSICLFPLNLTYLYLMQILNLFFKLDTSCLNTTKYYCFYNITCYTCGHMFPCMLFHLVWFRQLFNSYHLSGWSECTCNVEFACTNYYFWAYINNLNL